MNKLPQKGVRADERGLVAIVIVSTIAIILSLMTIGFTRIMDRELREAIDLDLATQAQYAAESGLNNARSYIAGKIANGEDPSTPGADCLDLGAAGLPFVRSISGSYNGNEDDTLVRYTCVLIDATPNSLVYPIDAGKSVVFKMTPAAASETIRNIYLSWNNKNADPDKTLLPLTDNDSEHKLPQESAVQTEETAEATGLLRATIYPVSSGSTSNDALAGASRTYFLYPNVPGSQVALDTIGYNPPGGSGAFLDGNCDRSNTTDPPAGIPYRQSGRYCNAGIMGIDSNDFVYVRLTAIYKNLTVSIQASNGTDSLELRGTQAEVDITGEGNDVLQRIQARVPLAPSYQLPEYALQSLEALCKRLRLPKTGSGIGDYGSANLDDPTGNLDSACRP